MPYWQAVRQNPLLPVRDRWRNPAVGPMDGRPGQVIVVNIILSRGYREFSDYDFEGLGEPSGWARLRCRTDALRKHPDVKRIGLDRPDAPAGRARTKARNFCRWICAARRSRLVHHGSRQAILGFAGSADLRPRRRAGATVWTRDCRYRTEPGPADASADCRQHAHLAARSRPSRNTAVSVMALLHRRRWPDRRSRSPRQDSGSDKLTLDQRDAIRMSAAGLSSRSTACA